MKVTNEFQFGFEVVSEEDLTKDIQAELQNANDQAEQMRDMILPLLHNLAKKPESPLIKWPNRVETINKFITQLFAVTGEKPGEGDLV